MFNRVNITCFRQYYDFLSLKFCSDIKTVPQIGSKNIIYSVCRFVSSRGITKVVFVCKSRLNNLYSLCLVKKITQCHINILLLFYWWYSYLNFLWTTLKSAFIINERKKNVDNRDDCWFLIFFFKFRRWTLLLCKNIYACKI